MRLPADATLVLLGAPGREPDNNGAAEANIAALIAAWRAEALPIVHVHPLGDPLAGEIVIAPEGADPFADVALAEALDRPRRDDARLLRRGRSDGRRR